MMQRVDLHVHTTASDATFTPSEAVFLAAQRGLCAVAITDHDSCGGISEAAAAAVNCGIELVPGMEVSVDYQGYGIHILGYFIAPDAPAVRRLLDWVLDERLRRNREIAAAMRADGIGISADELQARWPGAVIGRPHFAAALVELGLAENVRDAFDRYLSIGQRYFRKREYIPLREGLEIIRSAGGKPVFAHPFQYRMDEASLLALTRTLRDAGTVGMECIYSGYTPDQVSYLRTLAAHFGLCVTGGSDFHGPGKPHIQMGSPAVGYELLEHLKAPLCKGSCQRS